jgi:hypothetical protein
VASDGTLKLLVRTGESVIVDARARTIMAFTALAPAPGSIGAASGYDNMGHVTALATFTDGSQALLHVTVP